MTIDVPVPTLRSIAAAAEAIRVIAHERSRTIVGIAGSPGAGKSTIAEAIAVAMRPDTILLPMDGFHLDPNELIRLGRRDRMGAPDTFDVPGFVNTLVALRDPANIAANGHPGNDVWAPGFNRVVEQPVPNAIRIFPDCPIVVVEGNYLLHDSGGWEDVAPLLDACFFVSVDRRIRLQRLIDRHVAFGKIPTEAVAWAESTDEANARLIERSSSRADALIALD